MEEQSNNSPQMQQNISARPSQNGMINQLNQTLNNSRLLMNDQILGGGMDQQENLLQSLSQSGDYGDYGGYDDFPLDALAFNQGLAAYASLDSDSKGQKLKEARLMEALDRQTALLDTIGQSYKKNKDLRQKAEMRKLKNKLEKLESQKLFRDLEIQQTQIANEVAQHNNQLIFSHINAQAQLKANPIVISMNSAPDNYSSMNPLLFHTALNTVSKSNQYSKPYPYNPPFPIANPLLTPGAYPQRLPYGPGQFGVGPFGPGFQRPPFNGSMSFGYKGGSFPMTMPPFVPPTNKNHIKLPPLDKNKRKQYKTSDESFESPRSSKEKNGINIDDYLNNALAKHKNSVKSYK